MVMGISHARRTSAGKRDRFHARHSVDTVRCELGEVVDMSPSGMRLRMNRPAPLVLGQAVPIRLRHKHGAVEVHAIVRWMRRTGLRRREIGLQFLLPEHDAATASHLEQLAMFGFIVPRSSGQGRRVPIITANADLPDYYAVLGLTPAASDHDIRAAHRSLAKRHHPDTGGVDAEFLKLQRAYEVLGRPARRRAYDRARPSVG